MGEKIHHDPCVGGSSPSSATNKSITSLVRGRRGWAKPGSSGESPGRVRGFCFGWLGQALMAALQYQLGPATGAGSRNRNLQFIAGDRNGPFCFPSLFIWKTQAPLHMADEHVIWLIDRPRADRGVGALERRLILFRRSLQPIVGLELGPVGAHLHLDVAPVAFEHDRAFGIGAKEMSLRPVRGRVLKRHERPCSDELRLQRFLLSDDACRKSEKYDREDRGHTAKTTLHDGLLPASTNRWNRAARAAAISRAVSSRSQLRRDLDPFGSPSPVHSTRRW